MLSTRKEGPKTDPEGLLPRGVPPRIVLPPLGVIEKGETLVTLRIIWSILRSANYFSALAFYRLRVV